ncbi:MAG: protein phosphatase 2C domain-containing protein, partial [Anaerolineales bacterium]|nr:protein phosphatase 2C domain-containing protein [Anaerolineales bacterium]
MESCPFCGVENRLLARFCHACGRELTSENQSSPSVSSPKPISPNAPTEPLVFASEAASPLPEPILAEPPATVLTVPLVSPTAITLLDEREMQVEENLSQTAHLDTCTPPSLNRFRLLHLLPNETEGRMYEAEDLLTCWNCRHLQTEGGMNFCEECGASLEQKLHVHLREKTDADPILSDENHVLVEEHLYEIILPVISSLSSPSMAGFHWSLGYRTDPGCQREINEDSLLILQLTGISEMHASPSLGFFAIADGIGGHEAGEIASRTAIRTLSTTILRDLFIPDLDNSLSEENLSAALEQAIQAANKAILALRKTEPETNMGCTLTAAIVRESLALIANVGDSRTYLMRNGKLQQITHDHSVVANLLAAGILQPEERYTHAQRGVIYRSLGDNSRLEIDFFPTLLQP